MTLKFSALAALLLASSPTFAADDGFREQDKWALDPIILQLQYKDCPGAVAALNKGLATKHKDVLLMAGSMYEQGICLKPSWTSAENYYLQAWQAGNQDAIDRLIAGYARDQRDPAAALYWQASLSNPLPAACRLPKSLADDPDKFVAELKSWKPERLNACVYVVGVLAQVRAEIEFPGDAARRGLAGDLRGTFHPASGKIEWVVTDTTEIAVTRSVVFEESTPRAARDMLLKVAQKISDRALESFKKPDGIDPEWKTQLGVSFQLHYK